jgi:CRP-like cAMP-binding protein
MADLHPFALRRILALRQFPVLCDAELGELALFAENVAEVTLSAGTVVATAGSRLTALHLVLDGEITAVGAQNRAWRPRQVFGALEVLADRGVSAHAVTTMETTTLQLLAPDVTEILEDSFGVMRAALRGLAAQARMRPARGRRVTPPVVRSLGLVERLLVLRQQTAFSGAPLESLVALAHASEEVALSAGTVMTQAGDAGTSSYIIIKGASRARHASGATHVLGPGDVIGHMEILGHRPYDETIEAIAPLRALKIEAADLFDVIEDHTDFGRAILAALAGQLLDAPASPTS